MYGCHVSISLGAFSFSYLVEVQASCYSASCEISATSRSPWSGCAILNEVVIFSVRCQKIECYRILNFKFSSLIAIFGFLDDFMAARLHAFTVK